jgi:hypothetical protein
MKVKAIQAVLPQIVMYPFAEFDGKMKTLDWAGLPKLPATPHGDEETRWVFPEKFVDQLTLALADDD